MSACSCSSPRARPSARPSSLPTTLRPARAAIPQGSPTPSSVRSGPPQTHRRSCGPADASSRWLSPPATHRPGSLLLSASHHCCFKCPLGLSPWASVRGARLCRKGPAAPHGQSVAATRSPSLGSLLCHLLGFLCPPPQQAAPPCTPWHNDLMHGLWGRRADFEPHVQHSLAR